MKYAIGIIILMVSFLSNAQSKTKAFKRLSKAEKCWVITHPFKAKKAFKVSKSVEKTVDSILRKRDLGSHHIGNKLDAFKHSFWIWSLAESIGFYAARSLGKAHEKGNYQFYKKHLKEDGVLPDSISSQMDLFNNSVGLRYYRKFKKAKLTKLQKIELIKQAVLKGEMKTIHQKQREVYLDIDGKVLLKSSYIGLWNNSKVLVWSNTDLIK